MKKLFTAIFTAIVFFSLNIANAQTNMGEMIKFQTNGGPDANAYYVPASNPTDKVLILFHESWGLNDNIKQEADHWQKILDGKVAVYAIDLYDGKTTTDKFAAAKLMNNLDQKRGEAIIRGLLQKAGIGKEVATIGWGMGGTWAFEASSIVGKNAAGCIMYCGYPVNDDRYITNLKTDVLYHFGLESESITKAEIELFQKKVNDAGHEFTINYNRGGESFASLGSPQMSSVGRKETEFVGLRFIKHRLSLD